jgi:hypothetical protein
MPLTTGASLEATGAVFVETAVTDLTGDMVTEPRLSVTVT